MEPYQNPAVPDRITRAPPPSKSNPSLEWDQLPKFFEDLERNDANAALVVRLAVKVLVLTFLEGWITHSCPLGGVRPQEGPVDDSC